MLIERPGRDGHVVPIRGLVMPRAWPQGWNRGRRREARGAGGGPWPARTGQARSGPRLRGA
jgi:hypothetical protein